MFCFWLFHEPVWYRLWATCILLSLFYVIPPRPYKNSIVSYTQFEKVHLLYKVYQYRRETPINFKNWGSKGVHMIIDIYKWQECPIWESDMNFQIAGTFGVRTNKLKMGCRLCKFMFRLLYSVYLHICWTKYDEMGMILFCREVYHWLHTMYFLLIQVTFLTFAI